MNILFVSLGCDKNLVDSEVMLGFIREKGYKITNDEAEADIIVVNTCCFINDAKQESIDTILEMAEYKKTGKLKALVVTGCLAQRYSKEIAEEIPEVDGIVGTSSYETITEVIEQALEGHHVEKMEDVDYLPKDESERVMTTGGYYSYLKIAEGCDKHCTYCIIPSIRGKYRSRQMESLIKEATSLAKNGVKELILVAQETTLYGVDLYGEKKLPALLKELCKIDGIEWIRLLYCYPEEITDELIEVMKEEEKVCHYLDMPIQHASDRILKRMGRRTDHDELVEIVTKLKKEIPDIALRTTIISGFPGETQEDHEEVLDFVDEMNFDRLGVFTYSPEEGTPAAKLPEQIEEEVKTQRQGEIMALQQEISLENCRNMIGKEVKVLIEGKIPEDNVFIGRTYKDAPNVDGYFFVKCNYELMSGDFVTAKVTEAKEYDLIGEVIV
ncbi:ribosomal protein S12p Asp88 methylthiotransferase [Lachnospiraceae bacterium KM106-2]|nr:ribosomal protein S12p Asp88 methylthiotransferase [Lachnospiraceae bacterium KM106-2]